MADQDVFRETAFPDMEERFFTICSLIGIFASFLAAGLLRSFFPAESIFFIFVLPQIMTMGFILVTAYFFRKEGEWIFIFPLLIEKPLGFNFKDAICAEMIIFPLVTLMTLFTIFCAQKVGVELKDPYILTVIKSSDLYGKVIIFISVAVLAPLVEEVMFRNVLFHFFNKLMSRGVFLSAVLTSLIFALMHGEWYFIPGLFILGMSFQLLMIRRKSLTSSILMHSMHNTISVGLMILFN